MSKKIKILLILLCFLVAKNCFAYDYNGKQFNISIPENISYLEYCYYSGVCIIPKRSKKIIKINEILIRKGLKPLY